MTNVHELVPRSKSDYERAHAAIQAGYPAVEPILGDLIEWLQDCNWPVAKILVPFLQSIGEPLVPHIWHVLESDDDVWRYWVLGYLVPALPPHAAAPFRSELERLCYEPRHNERAELLDDRASSAVAEEVDVALRQIDPNDAIGDCDVLDLMERIPKLEHPVGREEVARVRVRFREDRGALSDDIERKVIDRFDERVRPVAPVDAG